MMHTLPAIDAEYLRRQREWSSRTFGPGDRQDGIIDHSVTALFFRVSPRFHCGLLLGLSRQPYE